MFFFALATALAGTAPVGQVALMTFAMEAPYGLSPVGGRRPDGSVVMTGNGAWFRAGYGARNPLVEGGQPGQPPAHGPVSVQSEEHLVVDGRPTTVRIGVTSLTDGTAMASFEAEIGGDTVRPFRVEALLPSSNAGAWVVELKRSLATVELQQE